MLDHLKKKPAPKPAPDTAPPPADAHPLTKALDAIAGLPAPKKPKAEKPSVVRACGHKQGLADLEGSACAGCQAKRRREKKAARWAKRESAPSGKQECFRFPTGTHFGDVLWDGEDWCGTLSVPLPDMTYREFSGRAGGVERLLRELKGQYLAWAVQQGNTAAD